MNRTLRRRRLPCIVGIGVAGLAGLILARTLAASKPSAANPPNPPQPAADLKPDRPKSRIELPATRILARQSDPATNAGDFLNPKVQPGKILWHKDYAAACRAAKISGKPVLLFQMMGKLDDRFC
jgi:hypothetical protein